mgnify:CR=1 FL=1
MDFQYDVFISKNSKDAALAQEITTFLEENGLTCFNSDTQLRQRGDTKFGKQIDDAVAHSKNLVLVCSDLNYLNSKWVEYEWTFFKDKSRHVDYEMGNLIPVMPEGVDEDELPGGLQYIQRISIQSYQESLLDYIKPDFVHVLYKGRIVMSAGPELALELEEKGYDWIKEEIGEE